MEVEAVSLNGPYGQPIDGESGNLPLMEMAGSLFGQLASIGADNPLREICYVLCYKTQSIAPRQQHHRIAISSVQIGARSFMSGVDLGGPVGYHIPESEKWIKMPPPSQVEALGVAFCSEELTGNKFIFTNSDSDWVMITQARRVTVAVQELPRARLAFRRDQIGLT